MPKIFTGVRLYCFSDQVLAKGKTERLKLRSKIYPSLISPKGEDTQMNSKLLVHFVSVQTLHILQFSPGNLDYKIFIRRPFHSSIDSGNSPF